MTAADPYAFRVRLTICVNPGSHYNFRWVKQPVQLYGARSHIDIIELAVKKNYGAKLDAMRRLTIRNASTEFYHVTEYEDGTVKLEPRVLVSPDMLKQIDADVERHKAGHKGTKLNWSKLPDV